MAACAKPCRYCRRWFRPDPRVGEGQYACSEPECQKKRQAANEAARLAREPDYFRGRSEKHRAYRRAHPEVNRRWREKNPEARERDRLARRDRRRRDREGGAAEHKAIALQLTSRREVDSRVSRAAEHKAIRAQTSVLVGLVAQVSRAAEHKEIALALEELHDRGRRLLGGGHGKTKLH
jgi:hypothetical protein